MVDKWIFGYCPRNKWNDFLISIIDTRVVSYLARVPSGPQWHSQLYFVVPRLARSDAPDIWDAMRAKSGSRMHIQQMGRKLETINGKNTKKSPIHENADANITCDFGDGDISRLGVANQKHGHIHSSLPRLYLDLSCNLPFVHFSRDKSWAEEKKMGAFLSVSRGSEEPLKFVEVEYQGGEPNSPPIAIVGKGVTFDR